MMSRPTRLAACLLASLAFCLPARAASWSVDFTDLWWVGAAEDGWGVNVVQQGDVLFLTFFIYGSGGAARWVVAPQMAPTATQPATGVRFSGDIYRTAGPWFGTTFNPSAVTRAIVGNATVTFESPNAATLTYMVDNVTVTKAITRQPMRANSVAGSYGGGLLATASQCASAADNGTQFFWGALTVSHVNSQISFRVDYPTNYGLPVVCQYTGTYVSQGRLASVTNGTFTCAVNGSTSSSNNTGTFTMTALDGQMNGFSASFSGADQYCTYNGRFGGTRLPGT